MGKFTDAEGNEVEAFTQADVDKMLKDKADADAKAVNEKNVADKVAADKATAEANAGKTPLDLALAEITAIKGQLHNSRVKEYGSQFAGNDPEKIKQFSESFGRLSGYAEDDAGFELRAKDAARLAFGTDATMHMADLTGGGGRSVDTARGATATPEDKVMRAALGITEADVTKYGSEKK